MSPLARCQKVVERDENPKPSTLVNGGRNYNGPSHSSTYFTSHLPVAFSLAVWDEVGTFLKTKY